VTITVPPDSFPTIEAIAREVKLGRVHPVDPDVVAACWGEIEHANEDVRRDLEREKLIRSPSFEPQAGELSMVLKLIGAYLGGQINSAGRPPVVQVALVVPVTGRWRFQIAPLATTCDYDTECEDKPNRRKLLGRAACCRKAGHVAADVQSITEFADDTRDEFEQGGDIAFTVNPDDLKVGAYPLEAIADEAQTS